jgi:amino acid transporter
MNNWFRSLRALVFGKPLHNQEMSREKLPKWKALSVFSSDALSSVGYGPEQIVVTLAASGLAVYGYFSHAFGAVLLLLIIVTVSYAQVARANPGGGGSYSVAKSHLGETAALIAAAALFADYTLTVAVSVSSGTEALVSAFPRLVGHEVAIDLFVLFVVLTLVNLRGVREASTVFVVPTYLFILAILALIAAGINGALSGGGPLLPPASSERQPLDWAVLALVLRAFSNGCSSMTGIEAISNGVTTFEAPQAKNAIKTTYLMSGLLAVMLGGIAFLLLHYHIEPQTNETMLSQIAAITFGRGWMYYFTQVTTMMVLYLAANTSYNGLPPLLSLVARDGYMPRYLALKGERLNFSKGIVLLSLAAGILVAGFRGNVEHLISLYAIGVFLSFTIAQWGLVRRWHGERGSGWLVRAVINGIGALITGLVVLVIAISKFFHGAWLVLVFIPAMMYVFKKIRRHYNDVAEQLRLPPGTDTAAGEGGRNLVLVPISAPTAAVVDTLRYARMIGDQTIVLHVDTDEEATAAARRRWQEWQPDVPLVTIHSPYRMLIQPLVDYVDALEREKRPEDFITVLIPEFETRKWWHRFLHNQTGWILRTMFILKNDVIVATVPFHLRK